MQGHIHVYVNEYNNIVKVIPLLNYFFFNKSTKNGVTQNVLFVIVDWLAENSFSKEFETLDPVTLNTRLRVFYAACRQKMERTIQSRR